MVTATRPVGLAATAAFVWYLLFDASRVSILQRLLAAIVYTPIACWGLIGYMAFQYHEFNTPLAFAQTQKHWSILAPPRQSFEDKIESLLAGEPIWAVYTSDPVRSWRRLNSSDNMVFNLFFWNPILFVVALALILLGIKKAWLSGPEAILGLALLAIPYVTRAYEMSMSSHARFASIVIPAYIVLGRILRARPEWLTWCVLATLSVMLMSWSALFSAGYSFF